MSVLVLNLDSETSGRVDYGKLSGFSLSMRLLSDYEGTSGLPVFRPLRIAENKLNHNSPLRQDQMLCLSHDCPQTASFLSPAKEAVSGAETAVTTGKAPANRP